MRNRKFTFLFLFFATTLFWSCERDLDSEGISRITYYPVLTMSGEQWNSVPVGQSFTDAGVTAKEGETTIPTTVVGQVNTNVPGVYTITYTAVNKDGFSSSVSRYVGVYKPEVEAVNLSGVYKRNAGALGLSTITKVGPAFYHSDNIGGVDLTAGAGVEVNFYYVDAAVDASGNTQVIVPLQATPNGEFTASPSTFHIGAGGTPDKFAWVVLGPGYGTALRTFIKQ